jgi:glycosyltransferase involved in cell wall biosynthesis
VDGETGFFVDEQPERLAEAWERLLCDEPKRAAMGAAARARAEREFSPRRLVERVDALYADAASAAPRARR